MMARDMYYYTKGMSPMPPNPKIALTPFMAMVFTKIRNASRKKCYSTDINFTLKDSPFQVLTILSILEYKVYLHCENPTTGVMMISWAQDEQIEFN